MPELDQITLSTLKKRYDENIKGDITIKQYMDLEASAHIISYIFSVCKDKHQAESVKY